ncbi:MAG: nitroreductase family protein [Saccharofermentans sp.]|nr:nitroreductase family protein [Saccharofermentans sp.]
MELIDAIRQRHSVRQYDARDIEEDKILLLKAKIDELNAEGDLHLQFVEDAAKTYNRLFNRMSGLGSAPSVIACVGRDDASLDQRVGYYGEKLVLYAQTLGLNTCWTGTFNRKNLNADVPEGERLVISIAIGYGKDQGRGRKAKTKEQVSKVLSTGAEWFDKGVELALLAPTAINQQKFLIKLLPDETVEFVDKGGVYSQVDIGIVKCHFEIGSGRKQTPG